MMATVKMMPVTSNNNYAVEKECEICGKLFEVTHSLQKYCPDCRNHSEQKKKWMEENIAASVRRYGNGDRRPYRYEGNCKNCGKHFEIWGTWRPYCSNKCETEFRRKNTLCRICGKPETETDDYKFPSAQGIWYCSESCRFEGARHDGKLKKCPICGKEFLGNAKTFCSRECSLVGRERANALKQAEKANPIGICKACGKEYSKATTAKSPFELDGFCSIDCRRAFYKATSTGVESICEWCGKPFYWSAGETFIHRLLEEDFVKLCSEKCVTEYRNLVGTQYKQKMEAKARAKAQKEKAETEAKALKRRLDAEAKAEKKRLEAEEKERKRVEREKAKELKRLTGRVPAKHKVYKKASDFDQTWIEANGLCGICKTAYIDCSLMQTNFRVRPEGAHYHNSKIVTCPIFRG